MKNDLILEAKLRLKRLIFHLTSKQYNVLGSARVILVWAGFLGGGLGGLCQGRRLQAELDREACSVSPSKFI